MAKYHISEDDQVRACKAKIKCPLGGEEEHYSDKKEALESLEKIIEMEMSIAEKKPQKRAPQLTQALKSKMKYTGEEPEWFKSIKEESSELFGKPSEIIDEIEIEGRPTLVVWNNESLRKQDRGPQRSGYSVSRLEYRDKETGEEQAYLNTIYSTDESSERVFKNDELTPIRYLANENSYFYSYKDEDKLRKLKKLEENDKGSEETYNEKIKLWKLGTFHLRADLGRRPIEGYSFDEKDIPKDEKDLDKDIEKIIEAGKVKYDEYRLRSKTPGIDYSRVSDKLRGKGLGASLYIYTAKKLAEKDLVLSSSTNQTEEALKAWQRMGKDTKIPMKVVVTKYVNDGYSSNQERFAIDFRKDKTK